MDRDARRSRHGCRNRLPLPPPRHRDGDPRVNRNPRASRTKRMTPMRSITKTLSLLAVATIACATGCAKAPKYGVETVSTLPGGRAQVWAVAPAVNLSGQREVDPLLQSDV